MTRCVSLPLTLTNTHSLVAPPPHHTGEPAGGGGGQAGLRENISEQSRVVKGSHCPVLTDPMTGVVYVGVVGLGTNESKGTECKYVQTHVVINQ